MLLLKLEVVFEKGEENCGHLIEAHKECLRALGFKI
ncbi:PREDICTED: cytochrome c oxidase copper chaperone [Chaetura pelagica]|nr:PREDICTED: cytochrome c oxidase copper chaperone [Chaetura pelagica]